VSKKWDVLAMTFPCAICDEPCEPAPTNRGWLQTGPGKRFHIACIEGLKTLSDDIKNAPVLDMSASELPIQPTGADGPLPKDCASERREPFFFQTFGSGSRGGDITFQLMGEVLLLIAILAFLIYSAFHWSEVWPAALEVLRSIGPCNEYTPWCCTSMCL
jgi:hypothetical protein